ncbi:helix-turn-helix transcriptional regulator [Flavobacterium microcysteis]
MKFTVKDINIYFGNKIKEKRMDLNLSQEKLALKADIDRGYVNDIGKGTREVSLSIAYKLAKALEIPYV